MEAEKKLKITFYGGAGTVTGANFLLEDVAGETKMLFDCGLMQGEKIHNKETVGCAFPYDPREIDFLFVSHAHLDHIGRIPNLIKAGFKGKIYSTPPTKDISELMLIDSISILAKEAKDTGEKCLYDEGDVKETIKYWDTIPYGKQINFTKDFSVNFRDSGHVLGSAMIEIMHNGKKLVYTGDLGNSPSLLLNDTEFINDADYLIMESVYGDKNHDPHSYAKDVLEDVIEDTVRAGGTLMIPAFSIEKTQEILFEIKEMMVGGRIPLIRVYLDSPLAIKVTDIYKKYKDYFNPEARKKFGFDNNGDIFNFPQLFRTLRTEESREIKDYNHPKIIIAGSGMSTGGRIQHHEKNYLSDKKSTLLFTGYQSAHTLGRYLQEGAKSVRILGETVTVNARVVSVSGYSAHKGSDDLLDFVNRTSDSVRKVFVALGEPRSSLFLVQKIRDNLAINAVSPVYGESYLLE